MDKHELFQQLKATFLDELSEHVEAINSSLLALEKRPAEKERVDLLRSLFRSAHTLKGASCAVGGGPLTDVCHQLENILAALQQKQLELKPELFVLLFKTVDAIEATGMLLRDEQNLNDAPLHGLLNELQAAASRAAPGPREAASAAEKSAKPRKSPKRRATKSSSDASPAVTSATKAPEPAPSEAVAKPAAKAVPSQPAATEPVVSEAERAPAASAAAASDANVQPVADDSSEPVVPARLAGSAGRSQRSSPSESGRADTAAGGKAAVATLRVAAEKLDSLLAQSGELLVARRRIESRTQELDQLRSLVAVWRREWRAAELWLRQLFRAGASPEDVGARAPAGVRKAGEAVTQNGHRLRQLERKLEQAAAALEADGRLLRHTCDALDSDVEHMRMFPFAEACAGLERAVRDLVRSSGKDVLLVIEGGDVEVDRSVLEALKDPLLHLVRNAVDHGVESPEQRERTGKPRQATVTVSAALCGTQVQVVVADDGRGFDVERIRERLRQKGLPEPQNERELIRTLFLPGFSTTQIITDVSGRGVGLDVVQNRIEALHGTVDVSFVASRGARFELSVPLTLTKIRSVLLAAGGQTYAVATVHVVHLFRVAEEQVRSLAEHQALLMGDAPLAVAPLAEMLGTRSEQRQPGGKRLALLLTSGMQRAAFLVDDVLGEQEIVVKRLGDRLHRLRHVAGATILPSGRVALVLNVPGLIRTALSSALSASRAADSPPAAAGTRRLLIVDDSVTTRALLKSILETAGYETASAADGEQAWETLVTGTYDLVVADVDMPHLDGFQLTSRIRHSPRYRELPVILVTARQSDGDRARGVEVGANAYLAKSAFDQQNLLECVTQLL